MEFERSVYRIHERMFQSRSAKRITDIIFKVGLFLSKMNSHKIYSCIFDYQVRSLSQILRQQQRSIIQDPRILVTEQHQAILFD